MADQAQQLEPLTIGQLAWVLKHLPDKACGPDAVSAQLLHTAPPLALQSLLKLFQEMETQAMLPTQLQMHMVVMLPKNSIKERPITLTSVLYRVWCRLCKPHGKSSAGPSTPTMESQTQVSSSPVGLTTLALILLANHRCKLPKLRLKLTEIYNNDL